MVENIDREIILEKFRGLNIAEGDICEMLERASVQKFDIGEILYKDSASCYGFFVVKKGEIRAFIMGENAKEITLFNLKKGDECILCSLCISDDLGQSVTLQVKEPLEIIVIPPSVFIKFREKYVTLTNYALSLISRRFSQAISVMTTALFTPLSRRIRDFLDQNAKSNIVTVTHENLANEIGSAREAVSRVLKEMQKNGEIKLLRGKILIKK